MAKHKYRVGERVEYASSRLVGNVPAGIYTITRCMPAEGPDPQYRVKSARDAHERVIQESQLRKS